MVGDRLVCATMTRLTFKRATAMSPFRISRSCTVSLIRVQLTPGLAFSGAIPHTCSQLSLFDAKSGLPTGTPDRCGSSIELGPAVVCIRKPPTKRLGTSSAASIARSMAATGAGDGIAASSGYAGRSSIRTEGSTSTRCSPRQPTISTVLSAGTSGMNGGTASSAAIRSSGRARNAMSRPTSPSTSAKEVKLISRPTSARGNRRGATSPHLIQLPLFPPFLPTLCLGKTMTSQQIDTANRCR